MVLDARLEAWLVWLKNWWKSHGAHLWEMGPLEHDRISAIAQFGVLELALLFSSALRELGLDAGRVLDVATPNSRLLHAVVGRMLNPAMVDTYVNLSIENKSHTAIVAKSIRGTANRLAEILERGDREGMRTLLMVEVTNLPDAARKRSQELAAALQRFHTNLPKAA